MRSLRKPDEGVRRGSGEPPHRLPPAEIRDNERLRPGEGVIDLHGALKEMTPEEVARLGLDSGELSPPRKPDEGVRRGSGEPPHRWGN